MAETKPELLLDRAASRLARLQAPCVRLFGENGDLKVLSVLLAALLFLLIRPFAADSTKTFSVPVRVVSSNNAVTVVDYAPRTVSVTVHGRQNQVNSFDPSQLAMELEEAFPDLLVTLNSSFSPTESIVISAKGSVITSPTASSLGGGVGSGVGSGSGSRSDSDADSKAVVFDSSFSGPAVLSPHAAIPSSNTNTSNKAKNLFIFTLPLFQGRS